MMDRDLYLAGEWTRGASRKPIANPATGDVIGSTAIASGMDVDRAVMAAEKAQRGWQRLGPAARRSVLNRVADGIDAAADTIAWTLTAEQGKPFADSLKEVQFGAEVFRFYAEEAMRVHAEIRTSYVDHSLRTLVERRPVGVVGAIVPWNYPVDLWAWKVAGALAAGNSVVVKPPVETPLSCAQTIEAIENAGLPNGVLSDLPGGAEVGRAIVRHPHVGLVSVTASTATGRAVVKDSAEHLPRLILELGGHAPFVVLDDADVEAAASAAARRSFSNMGQICIAVNRIIVAEQVADAFTAALASVAKTATPGPTADPETRYGSMTTAAAKERTIQHIEDAVSRGGRLVVGGGNPEGLRPETHINPAVLDDVGLDAAVMNEETFGPVAAIHRVASDQEAVAVANGLPYGLAAYVYSDSLERGWRFADQLDFGMIGINVNDTTELSAPFGGWKLSGFGSELGREGLEAYTNVRTVRMKVG